MFIRITKGTPKSGIDLCEHCIHARHRLHDNGLTVKQCSISDEKTQWATVIASSVVECSEYHDTSDKRVQTMMSLAWVFVKKSNGDITFVDPNIEPSRPTPRPPTWWQKFKWRFQRRRNSVSISDLFTRSN